MQGASATGRLLREINSQDVRVFVIWEPVLATDFVAPSTAALARIADARAEQYWDRKRALSHLLGERNRSTVVWDHIAVYAPGTLWQDASALADLKKLGYMTTPVIVIDGAVIVGFDAAKIDRALQA